ncbi:addiction module protein [Bacteroidia bacterium]|nr:addiction module protein [Bacteroidia bacterium]
MREILFMPKAWQDLEQWLQTDVKIVKKIFTLLENARRTPFEGLGQPEPLKANHTGYWSRRITLEHRFVYKVEVTKIVVHSLYGHYQD